MTDSKYDQPANVTKRLRYFDGQFLTDDDFINEQWYHNDARDRHHRVLHVSGIADGLAVTVNSGGLTITVEPGTAVDNQGRQIILADSRVVSVPVDVTPTMYVEIAFNEEATDLSGPQSAITSNTRFEQRPLVTISATRTAETLLLAELTVVTAVASPSYRTVSAVSTASCVYSGLRLPGPPGFGGTTGVALRARGDGQAAELSNNLAVTGRLTSASVGIGYGLASQTGALAVNGNVGIGTATPTTALDVRGAVTIGTATANQPLTVNGAATITGNTYISGQLGVNYSGTPPQPGYRMVVGGAVAIWGALNTSWDITTNRNLNVTGRAALNGGLDITGTALLNTVPIATTGANTFTAGQIINTGSISILNGTLGIGTGAPLPENNRLIVAGNMVVYANSSLLGTLSVGGAATIGALTVSSATTLNGAVTVGTAAANQSLTVNGQFTATGLARASGGLEVTGGAVTIGTAAANQSLTVNGGSTMTGLLRVNGGLEVTGGVFTVSTGARIDSIGIQAHAAALVNLHSTTFRASQATVDGTLAVAGPTNLSGALNVGTSTTPETRAGFAQFAGGVSAASATIAANMTAGTVNVTGAIQAGSVSTTGAVTLNGGVTSTNANLSGTLTVAGASTFNGAVTVGTAAANRSVTINGELTATGLARANGGLVVTGGGTTIGTTGGNLPLVVHGTVTISRSLMASGLVSASAGLSVAGGAVTIGSPEANQPLIVDGSVTARFLASSAGLSVTGGGVTIGTTTANQSLAVNGGASVSGNVGIGTTTPSAALDVAGAGNIVLSGTGRIGIGTTTPSAALEVAGAGNIVLSGTGRIGIGTTTPLALLDVSGNVIVRANGRIGIGTTTPRSALDTGQGIMTGAAQDYIKAQFALTGGGEVSWVYGNSGSVEVGFLGWNRRFIVAAAERGVTFASGSIDILMPPPNTVLTSTSDPITSQLPPGEAARTVTADGIPLRPGEALYAVHQPGNAVTVPVGFRIRNSETPFFTQSNWIFIAFYNPDDGTIKIANGMTLPMGTRGISHTNPNPHAVTSDDYLGLRIIQGEVNTADGSVIDGSGFTARRSGGFVEIRFRTAFSNPPTVVCSAGNAFTLTNEYCFASTIPGSITGTGFNILTIRMSLSSSTIGGCRVSFIAIGPR